MRFSTYWRPSGPVHGSRTAWLLMVMPRSRSMSIRSRYCARISRSPTTPVSCSIRSASVDFPWSMCAMMQKFLMISMGVRPTAGAAAAGEVTRRPAGTACSGTGDTDNPPRSKRDGRVHGRMPRGLPGPGHARGAIGRHCRAPPPGLLPGALPPRRYRRARRCASPPGALLPAMARRPGIGRAGPGSGAPARDRARRPGMGRADLASAGAQFRAALGDRGLAVRGLVLVDDALARGLVQALRRRLHRHGRRVHITGVGRLAEPAHRGLQRRLDGLVALARLLVLLVALDLGLYVRHAKASLRIWFSSVGAGGSRTAAAPHTRSRSDTPTRKDIPTPAPRSNQLAIGVLAGGP